MTRDDSVKIAVDLLKTIYTARGGDFAGPLDETVEYLQKFAETIYESGDSH